MADRQTGPPGVREGTRASYVCIYVYAGVSSEKGELISSEGGTTVTGTGADVT